MAKECRNGTKEEVLKLVDNALDNGNSIIIAVKTGEKNMSLMCAGNPVFAVPTVQKIVEDIIVPVANGKLGIKANQLEMMAAMTKFNNAVNEMIDAVVNELEIAEFAHKTEEKCAESIQKNAEKCEIESSDKVCGDDPTLKESVQRLKQQTLNWLRGEGQTCDGASFIGINHDTRSVVNFSALSPDDIPVAIATLLSEAKAHGLPTDIVIATAKHYYKQANVKVEAVEVEND